MKSWAKWTAKSVIFVTGFAAAGGGLAGVALAGTGTSSPNPASMGNISAVSGNRVFIPISIPVSVCGNAAAIFGFATASCDGGALASSAVAQGDVPAASHGGTYTGDIRILSGNVVAVPITVPMNLCGNAVAVLGDATVGCAGGAWVAVVPQRVAVPASVNKPAHAASKHKPVRHAKARKPAAHRSAHKAPAKPATTAGAHPLKPVQLATVGTLPAAAGGLGLVQPLLGDVPLLSGADLTTLAKDSITSLPGARLDALQASVAGQPLSDNSLAALSVGALLVGAAALKLASRNARTRRATGTGGTGAAS